MKKQVHLTRKAQTLLESIAIILIIPLCMLEDFEMSWQAISILVVWVGALALDGYILHKYGREY